MTPSTIKLKLNLLFMKLIFFLLLIVSCLSSMLHCISRFIWIRNRSKFCFRCSVKKCQVWALWMCQVKQQFEFLGIESEKSFCYYLFGWSTNLKNALGEKYFFCCLCRTNKFGEGGRQEIVKPLSCLELFILNRVQQSKLFGSICFFLYSLFF